MHINGKCLSLLFMAFIDIISANLGLSPHSIHLNYLYAQPLLSFLDVFISGYILEMYETN